MCLLTAHTVPKQARRTYESLRKRRLDEFMAGFNVISLKLKEMYQMITLGGDAELELVDSLDPFSEVGVEYGWANNGGGGLQRGVPSLRRGDALDS